MPTATTIFALEASGVVHVGGSHGLLEPAHLDAAGLKMSLSGLSLFVIRGEADSTVAPTYMIFWTPVIRLIETWYPTMDYRFGFC